MTDREDWTKNIALKRRVIQGDLAISSGNERPVIILPPEYVLTGTEFLYHITKRKHLKIVTERRRLMNSGVKISVLGY